MITDFSDTAKKQRFDSTTKGRRFARKRKTEFPISFGNVSLKLSIWLLGSLGFERFKLISPANIANSNFAFSAIPERPKDTRFEQNHEATKTRQKQSKMLNPDAVGTSKASK